jgi:hypothetical protein
MIYSIKAKWNSEFRGSLLVEMTMATGEQLFLVRSTAEEKRNDNMRKNDWI